MKKAEITAKIADKIKTNGKGEITAAVMADVLNDMNTFADVPNNTDMLVDLRNALDFYISYHSNCTSNYIITIAGKGMVMLEQKNGNSRQTEEYWLFGDGNNVNVTINPSYGKDIKIIGALSTFCCTDANITTLDVSHNPLLEYLEVWQNMLTTLNVSKNPLLVNLSVEANQLTTLDVSHNPLLEYLYVDDNMLTTLDVSHNQYLSCLDVARNSNLSTLDITKCPNIWELYVDGCRSDRFVVFGDTNRVSCSISFEDLDDYQPTQAVILKQVEALPQSGGALYIADEDLYDEIPESVKNLAESKNWDFYNGEL